MNWIKNLLLSLLCTALFPTFISDNSLTFSNSIFSFCFLIILYLFFRYVHQQNFPFRMKIFTHLFGFLLSAMTACGYSLEYQEIIDFRNILLILSILVYTHVYSLLLCVIWSFFKNAESLLTAQHYSPALSKIDNLLTRLLNKPLLLMGILLLCWMPCYISTFPGGFRYDATAEFNQLTNGFSGDFPLLHSLIITKLLLIGYELTGSYNTGIAFYTIAQMLLISAIFTHILHTLWKQQINRFLLGVLLVYYAAFPVIHMLVTCTVRDVLFSGLLTYCIFLFYLMALDCKSFMRSIRKFVGLAVVLVITLLSRNNNTGLVMPIVLVIISIIMICIAGKENRKGAIIFTITAISSYLFLSIALTQICQPLTPARTNSSLSLFSQSIVRTYLADEDNWSQEDKDIFAQYISSNDLTYVAENGDSTKWDLHIDENNLDDFLIFWAKIGIRYPGSYLNAILANTKQMWFPGAVVDGYQECNISSYSGYDKCYFSFTDQIASPGIHMQYLPAVREFYKNIGLILSFEKIPIISMLFSIGFHFWMLLNCFFYAEYQKCHHLRLPLCILLGYVLISAFVPLVLLRYFGALFFSFPLVLVFTLQPHAPLVKRI